MTRQQLHAEHAAAGANYAKALVAFRKSFSRLAAVERTLSNAHISDGETVASFYRSRVRLTDSLRTFQHPEFVTEILVSEWTDPIVELSDVQIREFAQDVA